MPTSLDLAAFLIKHIELSSIGELNSSILVGQGLKIWFFCKKQDGGIKRGCVAYQRVYMIKASIHHFYKHTSYKL